MAKNIRKSRVYIKSKKSSKKTFKRIKNNMEVIKELTIKK